MLKCHLVMWDVYQQTGWSLGLIMVFLFNSLIIKLFVLFLQYMIKALTALHIISMPIKLCLHSIVYCHTEGAAGKTKGRFIFPRQLGLLMLLYSASGFQLLWRYSNIAYMHVKVPHTATMASPLKYVASCHLLPRYARRTNYWPKVVKAMPCMTNHVMLNACFDGTSTGVGLNWIELNFIFGLTGQRVKSQEIW